MKTPTLAVYTTLYPQVRRFLPQWYKSLKAQVSKDFDLWLGVDGLTRVEVATSLGEEPPAHWVIAEAGESGLSVRLRAIERIIDRYDAIVFVDSDDVLAPSRVAAARQALLEHDVAGCALRIIDEVGNDTGAVFAPEPGWRPEQLLIRYNVFGLSNTAYRSDILRSCLPSPRDCILLDWFLTTRAWLAGADLWFDDVPRMLYRQYGLNTARVLPPFRPCDITEATSRVLGHYGCILPFVQDHARPHVPAFQAAQREISVFDRAMRDLPQCLQAYTQALNRLAPRFLWWWAVANPCLEHLWTK
jgi:hypothetical protein